MPIALFLLALFSLGGTSLTYLYDYNSGVFERVAIGIATGLAGAGLIGFGIALVSGFGPVCLVLLGVISSSCLLLFLNKDHRERAISDVEKGWRRCEGILAVSSLRDTFIAGGYLGLLIVLFLVFKDAMFYRDGGAYTGVQNDYGDLMLHLSVIARFAKGGNVPPIDPSYAGIRFTYPFLSDFVSALFMKAGASLRAAMFLEGFPLAAATLVLMHRWTFSLTGDRIAAAIAVLVAFFSGGLGWIVFLRDAFTNDLGFSGSLNHLTQDYTMSGTTFWWANSLTSLLVPQRSLLLGVPLALIVFSIIWQRWRGGETPALDVSANREKVAAARKSGLPAQPLRVDGKPMIAAGLIAGLLPLAHTHTLLVVGGAGFVLALLDRNWRAWALFFAALALVASPQLWWLSREQTVNFGKFFAFHPGWTPNSGNLVLFWLANTGLFIPLVLTALLWPGQSLLTNRHRLFYLPFAFCFIIPNLFKLAPWDWDNIKVLFYWFLASAPLAAMVLARIWNRSWSLRVLVCVLVCSLTLAGALDVWRVVSGASQDMELSSDDLAFARAVEKVTPSDSLILHAPIHNDPITVTGRQSFIGYPGHLWTRGIDPYSRVSIVSAIYAGGPDAERLISEFGIQYAVVSPAEESKMPVNADFFSQFNLVVQIGSYSLYKLR